MNFRFHPDASEEFDHAVAHYERCQPGLGLEFAEEVYVAVARIARFPEAGAQMSAHTRRSLANRFPDGIIYQMTPDTLRIIAVANLLRRPGYWQERLE